MDRLSLMETFVCVVETGSFSAAARRLGVGQPAVSKAIAHLEERLGTRLLLRSTRGLATTDAGQGFYEGALRTIEQADETDLIARGTGASLVGRLRICAAVTFARLHVVPRLPVFLGANPDLSIDVVLDDRQIDLIEHGIDVALRMGDRGDPDGASLAGGRIAHGRRLVVGTPDYFSRAGEPATPTDLAALETIVYTQEMESGDRCLFRRGSEEIAVTVSGRVRVTAAEGVRSAVRAGMGMAIASEWMFAPELASGEVKAVLGEWTLPGVDLWALYPSGRLAGAKARAFVAFVQAGFIGAATL